MAENLGKWPSKRGLISKISPSDGSGRNAVPFFSVEWWYNFPESGSNLANQGVIWKMSEKCNKFTMA